jgi:hypothetical protein
VLRKIALIDLAVFAAGSHIQHGDMKFP